MLLHTQTLEVNQVADLVRYGSHLSVGSQVQLFQIGQSANRRVQERDLGLYNRVSTAT